MGWNINYIQCYIVAAWFFEELFMVRVELEKLQL